MARNTGWTFVWALLLGILATSIYWLYGPFLKQEIARQVKGALQNKEFTLETIKGTDAILQGAPKKALGSRFQLISAGGQTFMADLQEGRVWRYFHHTREGGWGREAEGFIPLKFYFNGQKYYTANEISPAKPNISPSAPGPGSR